MHRMHFLRSLRRCMPAYSVHTLITSIQVKLHKTGSGFLSRDWKLERPHNYVSRDINTTQRHAVAASKAQRPPLGYVCWRSAYTCMLSKDCRLCEFTGNIHPTDTRMAIRTGLHFVRCKCITNITFYCTQCSARLSRSARSWYSCRREVCQKCPNVQDSSKWLQIK